MRLLIKPRLRRDWPHARHICTGTGAHRCHICTGTGPHRYLICTGAGLALSHLHRDRANIDRDCECAVKTGAALLVLGRRSSPG